MSALPLSRILLAGILVAYPMALPRSSGEEVRFPRRPALSPDGSTVIFTYEGDLWSVSRRGGEAARLTVHPAYDHSALWSPDGRSVAFASNRHGADDVFVMPAAGGAPRRLTAWSGSDWPSDWTPDGKALLIHSSRNASWTRGTRLYRIDATHIVEPIIVNAAAGDQGKLSSDGGKPLFVREGVRWTRKRYRGSQSGQIWLSDLESGSYRCLARGPMRHAWPLWLPGDREILYVREEAGTDQLFRRAVDGEDETRLTSFEDDGVRHPSVSADGRFVVFEGAFDLFSLELPNGKARVIPIEISTDMAWDAEEAATLSSASQMAPSPDGSQIAFVSRGEIWVRRAKEGLAPNRITRTVQRESSPAWASDGKSLFFVSDREGRDDLYTARSAEAAESRLDRCLEVAVERL
ncbi:MAG: peptidase S41, partial [Planctomycetota bacterium]